MFLDFNTPFILVDKEEVQLNYVGLPFCQKWEKNYPYLHVWPQKYRSAGMFVYRILGSRTLFLIFLDDITYISCQVFWVFLWYFENKVLWKLDLSFRKILLTLLWNKLFSWTEIRLIFIRFKYWNLPFISVFEGRVIQGF